MSATGELAAWCGAARDAWQEAVEEMRAGEGGGRSAKFYAALALDHLGHADQAAKILDRLATGPAEGHKSAYDFYLAGLVENYRQQDGQALADFHRTLELDPGFWQARVELQWQADFK